MCSHSVEELPVETNIVVDHNQVSYNVSTENSISESENTSVIEKLQQSLQQSLQHSVVSFIRDRKGGGRETAVKGTALDRMATCIEDIIKDISTDFSILKGRKASVPGFFRPSKNWDIVIKRDNVILAVIELKSLTRSHGNNFNNRVEESLGNAIDLRVYHEHMEMTCPFIGYLLLIDDSVETNKKRNTSSAHGTLEKFKNTGYFERAHILCDHLNSKNIYHSAQVISYQHISGDIAVESKGFEQFITSLQENLIVSLQ
jgi:hypothetical protein